MGFPGVSVVKNPPANAGDAGSIPGLGKSPGEGNGNLLQCSCLGNPMDRSLDSYSPWGCKRAGHDLANKQQQHSLTNDHKLGHLKQHKCILLIVLDPAGLGSRCQPD